MKDFSITLVAILYHLVLAGGAIYLISIDKGWWSLILLCFCVNIKFKDKDNKKETNNGDN